MTEGVGGSIGWRRPWWEKDSSNDGMWRMGDGRWNILTVLIDNEIRVERLSKFSSMNSTLTRLEIERRVELAAL
jgi:hypothetical protein